MINVTNTKPKFRKSSVFLLLFFQLAVGIVITSLIQAFVVFFKIPTGAHVSNMPISIITIMLGAYGYGYWKEMKDPQLLTPFVSRLCIHATIIYIILSSF